MNATTFIELNPMLEKYSGAYIIAGCVGLIASLKIFKFLSISKKMNTLWFTLSRAAPDLLAFLVGYAERRLVADAHFCVCDSCCRSLKIGFASGVSTRAVVVPWRCDTCATASW